MKVLMSSLMKIKSAGENEMINHLAYWCIMLYTEIYVYT